MTKQRERELREAYLKAGLGVVALLMTGSAIYNNWVNYGFLKARKSSPSVIEQTTNALASPDSEIPRAEKSIEQTTNSTTTPDTPKIQRAEQGIEQKIDFSDYPIGIERDAYETPETNAPAVNPGNVRPQIPIKTPDKKLTAYAKNTPPNPRGLVTNEFFRDSSYINEQQIADLLRRKNSCLKTTGIEKTIVQSAETYNINPVLLLARLQVEQSLLEKKNASPRTLKKGMGYGVFDNGKKLPSSSIHSQIRNAAECLSEHYNSFVPGVEIKVDYGKRKIAPRDAATHALYRYTPHTSGYELNRKVLQSVLKDLR